ncbi:hypothetical protein BH09BAC1_BH09BAC1_12000 [soil metagenome]
MKTLLTLLLVLFAAFKINAQCFEPTVNHPIDSGANALTTADFNNDGIADLAVISYYEDSVFIFLGTGSGGFSPPTQYHVAVSTIFSNVATAIISADFNRDGKIDLAIGVSIDVIILLGNGNGTFGAPVAYPTSNIINSLITADFNGDGKLDVAAATDQISTISVLLGNGNGTFATAVNSPSRSYPYALTSGYLNGDTILDIAVTSYKFHELRILIGIGNGRFTLGNTYPTTYDPRSITSADFNGDGFTDLATANEGIIYANTSYTQVFMGNGNGTFANPVQYSMGFSGATSIANTDFDNDGFIDLAIANDAFHHVTILKGNGDGTFADTVNFPVANSPWGIVINDFNQDGLVDVATANMGSSASVLLQAPGPAGTIADTSASCQNSGSVGIAIHGGTSPYTYRWNTGDTTLSLSNVPAGVYKVTVTDDNGCKLKLSDTIASSFLTLDSLILMNETCAAADNGSVQLYISGANPPFTYSWSTGNTSSSLPNISAGTYTVTITDSDGCFTTQTAVINQTGLLVDIEILANAGACANPTNGVLAALPQNGTAPYTFQWSNGQTIDTISNLLVGGYALTTTDALGCVNIRHEFVAADQTCYSILSGRVYFDADGNCTDSLGDIGFKNRMVKISPSYYAYTNAVGEWSVAVPMGNYRIYTRDSDLLPACNIDTILLAVVDSLPKTDLDLPRTAENDPDISTNLNCGGARPGFAQYITVSIGNNGLSPANVSGVVTLDAAIISITSPQLPAGFVLDSISANTPLKLYFHYNNLAPQGAGQFMVAASVPTIPTVSLGQVLRHTVLVSLQNGVDELLANNDFTCSTAIQGAYDPNDKQVFSKGVNVDGNALAADTLLNYIIRFQNTGTDTAFNVLVIDTIAAQFNLESFRLVSSSHQVDVRILEDGIVHFVFNNILLPDSNINEPASHGFIEFQLELTNPAMLSPIHNQAAIYFDFNPPIFTNTVTTTRITVGTTITEQIPMHISPNPTTGKLLLTLSGLKMDYVALYDITGRNVLAHDNDASTYAELDASHLSNGIYILRVRSGAAWYQAKVVVAK